MRKPQYTVKQWSSEIPTPPKFWGCVTLDDVKNRLLEVYPDWFVYRGGSHVALHKTAEPDSDRLGLIIETI